MVPTAGNRRFLPLLMDGRNGTSYDSCITGQMRFGAAAESKPVETNF